MTPERSETVEQFMARALYDPEHGYYCRPGVKLGPRGDFSTAATLHPALGTAIARWLLQRHAEHGSPERWTVIECGAGDGSLANALLDAIPKREKQGLNYHIVEISSALRLQQKTKLSGRQVRWFETMPEAIEEGLVLVFSNEFVDAFPAAVFRWERGAWRTALAGPSFGTGAIHAPDRGFSSLLDRWMDPPEGRQIEVHFTYRDWLQPWISKVGKLEMLTIDYGGTAADLAELPGTDGTLRAYTAHHRLRGAEVFLEPGLRDITADVNFTDLQKWGMESGLRTVSLQDQAEFLVSHLPDFPQDDPALRQLMHPDGAGSAFKVLWQSKQTT